MGEPLKAEMKASHFATIVSPSLAATPFGERQVFGTPAVSFAFALMPAFNTYGNSAPLFLKRSKAVMPTGVSFTPSECLRDNPVEDSYATSHGHMGTIKFPNGGTVPGAINCGVLPGPNADCSAELEGLLEAIAERMAAEFMQDPLKFLSQFKAASDATMLGALGDTAKGWWDTIKGAAVAAGGAIKDGAVASYDYVTTHSPSEIASDAVSGAKAAYDGAVELTSDAIEFIDKGIDALKQLSFEDLKQIFKEWLREVFGELVCSLRDALAQMAADPRPMATQLGEVDGMAKAFVAETAGAVLVDTFVTKGAMSAASKIGRVAGKVGPKIGSLVEKIKRRIAMRRGAHVPEHPSRKPDLPEPKKTPHAPEPEKKPKNDGVEGQPAQADSDCLNCSLGGRPVNVVTGSKLLDGEEDLDFVIDAPMPLIWQRVYASKNSHEGWLGQGWSLPIDLRLDVDAEAAVLVDQQGRRTRFPSLAIGDACFSASEQNTLRRIHRHQYELVGPEGLRLIFGLSPRDFAGLDAMEREEAARAARFEELARTQSPEAAVVGAQPPLVDRLVLLGWADPNNNWLRIHYAGDDLPQVIETSSGRHVGLRFSHFDSGRKTRLHQVIELLGEPDAEGRFGTSRRLVEYRYDEHADLVAVVDDQGQIVRTFAWANHMMVEHGQPGGIVSRYEWDQLSPRGRVLRNQVSNGEDFRFHYDPANRESRIVDVEGRVTTYRYDDRSRVSEIIDAAGGVTRYERDINGNIVTKTDAAGRATRHAYTADGNLARVEHADGSAFLMDYDPASRKVSAITDPLGRTTHFVYDARGNLVEIIAADGASTRYERDGRGLPVAIVDARGGRSLLQYDRHGRLVSHQDCLGQPTRMEYDDRGNLISSIDALGRTTRHEYRRINRSDRVCATTLPDGRTERYAYDSLGRLIAYSDPAGRKIGYQLDADGRPLVRTNQAGHALRYRYDVHGRLVELVNENGATHRFYWDRLDRVVSEQGFDGRRQDYRYDSAGDLVESVDGIPEGSPYLATGVPGLVRTRYERDLLGRLVAKISVKHGAGSRPQVVRSRFRYDAAGQLVEARNPAARLDLFYSEAGRVAREVMRMRDGRSATLAHEYDGLGNRVALVLPDGRRIENRLYGSGHVGRIDLDGIVVSEFERDALQQESVRTQGALRSFYERDDIGRLLSSHTRVGDGETEVAAVSGARLSRRYGYDALGRLAGVTDALHGDTSYAYDVTSRLVGMRSGAADERFTFDPAGNLIDADAAAFPEAANVDLASEESWRAFVERNVARVDFNLLQGAREAQRDPQQWGGVRQNQIAVHQEHRYRYDRWGNCVEKRSGARAVYEYRWNAEHQLVGVDANVDGERQCWRYEYDALGRRTAKYRVQPSTDGRESARPRIDAQSRVAFTWDGNRLLVEHTAQRESVYLYEPDSFAPLAVACGVGAPSVQEAPEPALPSEMMSLKERYPEQWAEVERRRQKILAKVGVVPEEVPAKPAARILYFHNDQIGTPRELTDADGNLVWTATYKAWGRVASIQTPPLRAFVADGSAVREVWTEQRDPVVQNLRHQGQYFDAESGLHYNRFRHYDPDVGRFLSQDPIGLSGGFNLYEFGPNPTGWIDPLGLAKKLPAGTYSTHSNRTAVQRIAGRFPINKCYAGKVYPSDHYIAKDAEALKRLKQKYPHGVPFNMAGLPDFSRYAVKNVNVGSFTSDSVDFRRANELAFGKGNPFGGDPPAGYTWHHTVENGKLQLLPQDIHDAVKHTGGAAASGCRR